MRLGAVGAVSIFLSEGKLVVIQGPSEHPKAMAKCCGVSGEGASAAARAVTDRQEKRGARLRPIDVQSTAGKSAELQAAFSFR
jgi:hypothetical protein